MTVLVMWGASQEGAVLSRRPSSHRPCGRDMLGARSGEGADEWGPWAPAFRAEEAWREAGLEAAALMGAGDGSVRETVGGPR